VICKTVSIEDDHLQTDVPCVSTGMMQQIPQLV